MASNAPNLTLEQCKQKGRTEKPKPDLVDLQKGRITPRAWINLPDAVNPRQRVRILTWNLLAQCLVRECLDRFILVTVAFKYGEEITRGDCLKAHQREHMIFNEITSSNANILCLQEVDRLHKLTPVLEQAGYDHIFAAGPQKKHGCLIAYHRDKYSICGKSSVCYDDQNVRQGDERSSRGSSFRTKNIASLVALKTFAGGGAGFIVATTHLFWHPRYIYERARQATILLRETVKFRDQINSDWPCVIAGDFNLAPDDPVYSLLVGDSILPLQEELLDASRVVHASIEPDKPSETSTQIPADEGAEKDPDKIITNARLATSDDGLLSTAELVDMVAIYGTLKSLYDEGQKMHRASCLIPTFGDRVPIESTRHGGFEPQWTSYTHYWKAVLDYIFVLDPPSTPSRVVGFLQPHTTENLEPGLPQKDVCGSDHVSLVCEICW